MTDDGGYDRDNQRGVGIELGQKEHYYHYSWLLMPSDTLSVQSWLKSFYLFIIIMIVIAISSNIFSKLLEPLGFQVGIYLHHIILIIQMENIQKSYTNFSFEIV